MAFIDAISELNGLKRRRVIRDYVLVGGVAATAYIEPMTTDALELIVRVDSDEECQGLLGLITEQSESQEGMRYVLGDVPVRIFPSTLTPLHRDVMEQARKVRAGSMRTKVAAVEHLILLGLSSNRLQDHIRIDRMLRHTNMDRLTELLDRFDDEEKSLAVRLQSLHGTGVPREGKVASPSGANEL